jgi:hypothetical protein
MASRLNHLFQTSPLQFLARTVLFVDGLTAPESVSQMSHKLAHFIDFEPSGRHARARVFPAQHMYQDVPLVSYYVPFGGITSIPREDPPHRFIFLPEFTRCRLLISADGPDGLRLQLEENLNGPVPPPDAKYLDSFAYWDQTTGHLVGVIRATAVLVKEAGQPWTILMQQIVGPAGHELVRQTFSRPLRIGQT